MIFNSDPKNPAHEVNFSRKKKESHASVSYINIEVSRTNSQKLLGLVLDNMLTFKKHIKDKLNKAHFLVDKIKRLCGIFPRDSVVTIYKSFIRWHLDYSDVIYDQPNNDSFTNKIEQLQYKTCLAITGANQGVSRECLYNELGLGSLSSRMWCRKQSTIYKLLSTHYPKCLFDIIPSSGSFYVTSKNQIPFFNYKTDYFKYSFFLTEWLQLAPEIQILKSIAVFKNKPLSFRRPSKRFLFNVNDPEAVRYLTRLRLCFSHLNEHKMNI